MHAVYLGRRSKASQTTEIAGGLLFALVFCVSIYVLRNGGPATYLSLITGWCSPFLILLWMLGSRHVVALPAFVTIPSIFVPTFYLWIVDTLALRRGTWVIEHGTKLGWHLWDGLEIEYDFYPFFKPAAGSTDALICREALFFLMTNTMIVFGCITS